MILFDAALSRMTWRVCNPPLADLGGREERSVFICHHSMMQRPLAIPPLELAERQPVSARPGKFYTGLPSNFELLKLVIDQTHSLTLLVLTRTFSSTFQPTW